LSLVGGVRKPDDGIRKLVGVVGKLVSVVGKQAEGFNFLLNLAPSLTGTFGEFVQFGIDFAI
jgi:hypothetical protein